MTAKEYLKEIQGYRAAKRRLQRRIWELNEDLYTIGGFDYTRDRVQNAPPRDPLSDKVLKLIELQKKYIQAVTTYNNELEERERQIDGMEKRQHREILRLIYIDGLTIAETAEAMGLMYNSACHVHGKALQCFAKKFLME